MSGSLEFLLPPPGSAHVEIVTRAALGVSLSFAYVNGMEISCQASFVSAIVLFSARAMILSL